MNFEYKTEHLEGISDNKPNETEIIKHAKNKGFELKEVEIWFDKFQLFWRFSAEYINKCHVCKSKGYKTTLTNKSMACKKCKTYWSE